MIDVGENTESRVPGSNSKWLIRSKHYEYLKYPFSKVAICKTWGLKHSEYKAGQKELLSVKKKTTVDGNDFIWKILANNRTLLHMYQEAHSVSNMKA